MENQQVNLIQLYCAVQNEKDEEVNAYFAAMDQASANKRLAAVAEHYGFRTFWNPESLDGWRVMLAADLAENMYGTREIMGVSQLLRRKGADLIEVRGSKHNVLSLIRDQFGLPKSTSQVKLATWKHFLIAGLHGETPAAKKVWAYILEAEKQARVYEEMSQLQRPQTAVDLLYATRDAVLEVAGDMQQFKTVVVEDIQQIKQNVTDLQQWKENKDQKDKVREDELQEMFGKLATQVFEELERRFQASQGANTVPTVDLPPQGWVMLGTYLYKHRPQPSIVTKSEFNKLHKLVQKYCTPVKFKQIGADYPANFYDPAAIKKGHEDYARQKALRVVSPKKYEPAQRSFLEMGLRVDRA